MPRSCICTQSSSKRFTNSPFAFLPAVDSCPPSEIGLQGNHNQCAIKIWGSHSLMPAVLLSTTSRLQLLCYICLPATGPTQYDIEAAHYNIIYLPRLCCVLPKIAQTPASAWLSAQFLECKIFTCCDDMAQHMHLRCTVIASCACYASMTALYLQVSRLGCAPAARAEVTCCPAAALVVQ